MTGRVWLDPADGLATMIRVIFQTDAAVVTVPCHLFADVEEALDLLSED